jgi:Dyp-type peroxidase family
VITRLSADALADIQGFVTSGYGHLPVATYLFLHIDSADAGQQWLASVAPTITSAAPWPKTASGEKIKPPSAVNIGFTADGLTALGLPEMVRCTFPAEFLDGIAAPDRSAILGDTEESSPAAWEVGNPSGRAVHVALIVHGASADDLNRECAGQRVLLARHAGVQEMSSVTQHGHRPEDDAEPFGFHDGIAQPAIGGISGAGVPTGEFILGYANHYGNIPPTPLVPAELDERGVLPSYANPFHPPRRFKDLGANGSFVVYRKLQQDVAGFWGFAAREARRATGRDDADAMVWMASRMMGRWPGGAPLALSPERDDPRLKEHDDFLYDNDVDGLACPLGAHVRRTNPRAVLKPYPSAQSLSMTEAHRLLRRARVFGTPVRDRLVDDGVARGIHFFCVNASIKSQFEFVQQSWCNNPRFGGLNDNKDPIVGDNARTGQPSNHMSIPSGPNGFRTSALPRFVTVRGGAYLFMPGLAALRFLAAFRPGAAK